MRDLRHWENGGYFLFRPEIFDELNEDEDLVEDALVRLVRRGRVIAYPYKGYWSPADTVKERVQLDERYHRADCPWMIWDPERSGLPAPNFDAPSDRRRCSESLAGVRAGGALTPVVLPLHLELPTERPLSVLMIGAHPDDIEIGAGGTLLTLAESRPGLHARYVVLTGTEERQSEARNAAAAFLPDAEIIVDLHDLPEGRLPSGVGSCEGHLGGGGAHVDARSHPRAIVQRRPSGPSDDRRGAADSLSKSALPVVRDPEVGR